MGDVELYGAELCFIVSMVSAAHTSVILWDNCNRFLAPSPIPMYWKYAIFAFIALDHGYNPKVIVFRERLTDFLAGLFLSMIIAALIRSTGRIPRVDPPGTIADRVDPPATLDRETFNGVLLVLRENGIWMFGMWFIHVNSILILLFCVLTALVWMIVFELFLRVELGLTACSIILLAFGFDSRVKIAVPLDVVCFSVCYHTVGSVNGLQQSFLTGDASLILYSIFIMSFTTLVFFLLHLLLLHFHA